MRTVLLVPRRDDGGPRDRLWAWCRARWERYCPDLPIYEGHHDDGPFNRSAAINRAAAAADLDGRWDQAVVIDSDIFVKVSQVRAAIARAAETGRVTWSHRRWRGLTEHWTERIVADQRDFGPEIDTDDMDVYVQQTNPISWSCCFVVPRAVWDDLGGFDERFSGWGFEDMAWQAVVKGLYGFERIEADVYHLWHPRSEERIVKGRTTYTATPEYIRNALLGRRYMVAVIRDHRIGDQPGEERMSAELSAVHVRNLMADDAKFREFGRRLRLPDWSDWWPTLEELRDGARLGRLGPTEPVSASVTVVVHSGGERDRWPERRDYLRRSLESLAAMVSGPIVQRVVYDVWGDDAIRAEIDAMATPLGFYVAGPRPSVWHPGHPWSRAQLWRYLAKRGRGDHVFGAEDDFVYDRPVELGPMIETLRANPYLRQLALLREPYFARELEAGGIVEQHPDRYRAVSRDGACWIEHRDHFTNNPSLFPRSLTEIDFPAIENSEVLFAQALNRDPRSRFAYWGDGSPWIHHIGEVRAATRY